MDEQAITVDRVWLNYEEAAAYCHLDRTTLWRAVRRGDLRAGGVGRAVRFEKAELDRWLRGDRGSATEAPNDA